MISQIFDQRLTFAAFGALAISIFLLVFRPAAKKPDECSLKDKIAKLDLGGTFLFISSTVCLFLSLIWGGNTYPWSDARIWSLIVASVLLMTAFLALQLRSGEKYAARILFAVNLLTSP